MPGDGVSLSTTIAQMGSVAKTQARGQATQQAHPADQRRQEQDEFKVERVQETDKSEKSRINPDDSKKDKRRQRRIKRRQGQQARRDPEDNSPAETHQDLNEQSDETREPLGSLVDCRV
jgi:hypothetical protein